MLDFYSDRRCRFGMVMQDDHDPKIPVAIDDIASQCPGVLQKAGFESQSSGLGNILTPLLQGAINLGDR